MQMAGAGRFNAIGADTVESEGGIGLLWYTKEEFSDFLLTVQWRSITPSDNSGVFLRFPALGNQNPPKTGSWRWTRATRSRSMTGDLTQHEYDGKSAAHDGCGLSACASDTLASKPLGEWNTFEIQRQARHQSAIERKFGKPHDEQPGATLEGSHWTPESSSRFSRAVPQSFGKKSGRCCGGGANSLA